MKPSRGLFLGEFGVVLSVGSGVQSPDAVCIEVALKLFLIKTENSQTWKGTEHADNKICQLKKGWGKLLPIIILTSCVA